MLNTNWTRILTFSFFAYSALADPSWDVKRFKPRGLRMVANRIVLPLYPPRAYEAHHEGLAAAEVLVAAQGNVVSVHILEAPDSEIAKSVVVAIKQWSFNILRDDNNSPLPYKGRILFYFRRFHNAPLVVDAVDEAIKFATQ